MDGAVTITVGTQEFKGWNEVEISHSVDAFSTLTIKAPMEPQNSEFRSWFVPFSFREVTADVDGVQVFHGVMLGVEPDCNANGRTVTITACAFPAVLGDCALSWHDKPFEFQGITPEEILRMFAGKFGLKLDLRADLGASPLKKKKYDPENTVLDFLVEIVRERNAVLSNTSLGHLLCWQSIKPGNPVAFLHQQDIPSIRARFSTQDYFSEITGIGSRNRTNKRSATGDEPSCTVRNPFLGTGVKRPLNIRVKNTDKELGAVEKATNARMGRMFGNMAVYEVNGLASWFTPGDKPTLWARNTTVDVFAPNAMIYRRYEFLIRTVTLKQDPDGQTANLELVLPGAFSGDMPESLPWLTSAGDLALMPGNGGPGEAADTQEGRARMLRRSLAAESME